MGAGDAVVLGAVAVFGAAPAAAAIWADGWRKGLRTAGKAAAAAAVIPGACALGWWLVAAYS